MAGNLDEFQRINRPRAEKIVRQLQVIEKSWRSHKLEVEDLRAIYAPVIDQMGLRPSIREPADERVPPVDPHRIAMMVDNIPKPLLSRWFLHLVNRIFDEMPD